MLPRARATKSAHRRLEPIVAGEDRELVVAAVAAAERADNREPVGQRGHLRKRAAEGDAGKRRLDFAGAAADCSPARSSWGRTSRSAAVRPRGTAARPTYPERLSERRPPERGKPATRAAIGRRGPDCRRAVTRAGSAPDSGEHDRFQRTRAFLLPPVCSFSRELLRALLSSARKSSRLNVLSDPAAPARTVSRHGPRPTLSSAHWQSGRAMADGLQTRRTRPASLARRMSRCSRHVHFPRSTPWSCVFDVSATSWCSDRP